MTRITRALLGTLLCASLLPVARADKFDLDVDAEPLHLCRGLQKNVRFMHNAWDSGDKATFNDIKGWLKQELAEKDERRAKLLKVYADFATRIEAGEYSEPAMSHVMGQINVERNAGSACLAAFPTDYNRAPRAPVSRPVTRD